MSSMKYIIMCGGEYKAFKTPKHLSVVRGEVLVERTIRLLKEQGVTDVYISSNNPIFDKYANVPTGYVTSIVKRLVNKENNFYTDNVETRGYWLDAFYPTKEPVCYIFGDVYFSPEAIKTIVEFEGIENTLFGNSVAKNEEHQNWGEPFAYKVYKTEEFRDGINAVKKLWDEGKTIRHPIVWELYRYLHNLDINVQMITTDYVAIDDYTIDVDTPEKIDKI